MSTESRHITPAALRTVTANDRFKRTWGPSLWGAMALGAVFHASILMYTPEVEIVLAEEAEVSAAQLIRLVNLAEIAAAPPPPEVIIPAPALPKMDEVALDLEIDPSLFVMNFDDFALDAEKLAPPNHTAQDEWLEYRQFAPFVVRPEIRNRTEMKQFLQRNYQRIYEYSGATGVVQVSFWIDEGGKVAKAEIVKSSGSRSLDRLALRLSKVMRFRPAMMAGRPIRILVHVPITFRAA